MAKTCARCGQALPRDNAKFCNKCGASTYLPTRPRLYEQIAQQPPSRPPGTGNVRAPDEAPKQEFHVKIWEKKEPADISFSEEDTIFPDESAAFPEDSVEDLPTAHLEATINRAPGVQESQLDDVAQLATSRLVTFPKPPLTPQVRSHPAFQPPSPPQEVRQAGVFPQPLSPVSIVTKPVTHERGSRKRLGIVLVLLFMLVAGGIAAWIIAFQPFAVASITQPWQQFCDSGLGVSGQYPTGWMKQVEQKKALHFSDGTDQFNIVTVAANGQDAGKYLEKEASQLGITALKPGAPLSFAGATWQQVQGSLLQTGVTYTETLLVTMHGNSFFTIMQIAPPGTYSEEDKAIFSGMRSSLHFSSICP